MNCGAPLPGDEDGPRRTDSFNGHQPQFGLSWACGRCGAHYKDWDVAACRAEADRPATFRTVSDRDFIDDPDALSPWMAAVWVLTLIGLLGALTFLAAGCGR